MRSSFVDAEYCAKERQASPDRLLAEIEAVMPGLFDAKIIAAPSSTANPDKHRGPATHPTKKGNKWGFGMKSHIGVDAGSGQVRAVSANKRMSPTSPTLTG